MHRVHPNGMDQGSLKLGLTRQQRSVGLDSRLRRAFLSQLGSDLETVGTGRVYGEAIWQLQKMLWKSN